MRMLGYKGPAQPSPALGDALNSGFRYLEGSCPGCDTHQTVALDIVRRPKTTPIHELERYMRCKHCSELQGRLYKRSHLVALRPTKISAMNPPSTWWPGRDDEGRDDIIACHMNVQLRRSEKFAMSGT
jgi:phage FluMu protein Com